jgi:hypothetical protein
VPYLPLPPSPKIPLPFFLRDDVVGFGWPRPAVGAFLAVWIIVYGQVQSWTPQLVLSPLRQSPPNKLHSLLWVLLLVPSLAVMGGFLQDSAIFRERDSGPMTAVIVTVLVVFAVVFAVNSAIHSYLIVKYCEGNKVAMDVGFYYMSNAAGRLVGTMMSGVLYTYAGDTLQGFAACFWSAVGFVLVTAFATLFLRDSSSGLACGPWVCIAATEPEAEAEAEVEEQQQQSTADRQPAKKEEVHTQQPAAPAKEDSV